MDGGIVVVAIAARDCAALASGNGAVEEAVAIHILAGAG
jgi:hypothetical protein